MASSLIDEFKKQTKNTILEHMDRLAVNNDSDSEKFEELLNYFLNDGFEVVDEDDFPEENVHVIEDIAIPDGYIEQNQHVTVCVEILRPINNPQKELDKLVGCTEIKKRMAELIALTKYNKLMKELFPNSKQHLLRKTRHRQDYCLQDLRFAVTTGWSVVERPCRYL